MLACPWCASRVTGTFVNCVNCGAPLPVAPAQGPGPTPPPAPRALPPRFVRRVRFTANPLFLIGAVFCAFAVPMGLGALTIGVTTGEGGATLAGIVTTLVFGVVGAPMARNGWRSAKATLEAFERGRATTGKVIDVYRDTSVKVNGRSPWVIVYAFQARAQTFEGKAQTWDLRAAERTPGQALHVLYVEDDPVKSTLYPPVA